jgi:beta-lactamase regulating signal transducer with metallopeptidase domain
MDVSTIIELGWKSFIIAGLSLVLLSIARSRSAAEKSLIGDSAILSLLLLPTTMAWLPQISIAAPAVLGTALEDVGLSFSASDATPLGGAPMAAGSLFDWSDIAIALYALPVALLLLTLAYSLLRLQGLYARAKVLEDGQWLTALAAAQNRLGVKHATALLFSKEVNSPISWGVVRPVIMIDRQAQASEDAEAIIAHELAHVHRLDWLKLILARAATAMLWFNPLVWMLARRCHQLREEAADDAVLRTRVAKADYATLLVTAVRHANGRPLLAANGVAPGKSSLSRRVSHILDGSKPRHPARLDWALAAIGIAVGSNAALAAAQPVLWNSGQIDARAGERAALELLALPDIQAQRLGQAMLASDWSVRRAQGDTNFSNDRAVEPLILALKDDNPTVRRIAIWGLSEMRPTPTKLASGAIARKLSDPSADVRAEAVGALGDFKSLRQSEAVGRALLDDPSPEVRYRAAHSLGDMQEPSTRRVLETAIRDNDPSVRAKARWALGRVAEAEEILGR